MEFPSWEYHSSKARLSESYGWDKTQVILVVWSVGANVFESRTKQGLSQNKRTLSSQEALRVKLSLWGWPQKFIFWWSL